MGVVTGDRRHRPRARRRPRVGAHRPRALRSVPHRRVAARGAARAAAITAPTTARSSSSRAREEATTIVVGLPLSLSGAKGPAAARPPSRDRGAARRGRAPTSRSSRTTSGSPRSPPSAASTRRGVRGRDRTAVVDKVAAAVMLQSWLESPGAPSPMTAGDDRRRPSSAARATPARRAAASPPAARPDHARDRRGRARPAARARLGRRVVLVAAQPPGSPGAVVQVQLDPGLGRAAHRRRARSSEHVIGSSLAFNVYARLNGDNSFQAGTYELHTNIGVKDAVQGAEGRARRSTTSSSRSRPASG